MTASHRPKGPLNQARLALAASCLCLAATAQAQSSITVFGVLDVGVQQLKNGSKSLNLMAIDGLQTSRLGFRGTEDLGGGLGASFHLEGALSPDTGGSTLDFRRRSTVSLTSRTLGELRLGRDYTPTFWSISRFNAFGTNGVGAASNLIYGFDGLSSSSKTVVRSDNSVGYFLPAGLGGVYGQAMVAAGEGTTGKYLGLRVGYANGPVDVAFGTSETTNTLAGDKFKVSNLGGSYQLGDLKLIGLWHESKLNSRKQSNWALGAHYTLGVGVVRVGYTRAHQTSSAPASDYTGTQLALGYVHNLSKRTALYGTFSNVRNSSAGKFTIPGGNAVLAGQSSRGTELGINHTF